MFLLMAVVLFFGSKYYINNYYGLEVNQNFSDELDKIGVCKFLKEKKVDLFTHNSLGEYEFVFKERPSKEGITIDWSLNHVAYIFTPEKALIRIDVEDDTCIYLVAEDSVVLNAKSLYDFIDWLLIKQSQLPVHPRNHIAKKQVEVHETPFIDKDSELIPPINP